jgi:hypothetical protein
MPAVIVTGGFLHPKGKDAVISTDAAALRGARRYAADRGADLKSCFEAWIPEPKLDLRLDIKGAVRMSEAEGVALRIMAGRTPLGRRLAMVANVHMVITISGRQHTEVVVEQALELGIPVLPVPDAGGDSEELLENHRARIAAAFDPGALEACLARVSAGLRNRPEDAADAVLDLIRTAKLGRCLVLLPYDEEHDRRYSAVIEPAVARQMIPVRLDRIPRSESIYSSFGDAIRASTAVIADISDLNENVMYEIGYAHGCGITPLIYARDQARLDRLPVYFRTLNVRLAPSDEELDRIIDAYLSSFRPARGVRGAAARS